MRNILLKTLLIAFAFAFTFCANKGQTSKLTEQSHGASAKPNYEIVFPDNKVNRIDIKIEPEKWEVHFHFR